jgi:hypothetical protein
VRFFAFLAVVSATACTFASDWVADTTPAVTLARLGDQAIKSMKGTQCDSLLTMELRGTRGYSKSQVLVENSKLFSIQFTELPDSGPVSGEVRFNGGRKAFRDDAATGGKIAWAELSKAKVPFARTGKDMVARFPFEFPRLVWSGLITGSSPLEEFARFAPSNGFSVKLERKTTLVDNRRITTFRQTYTRNAALAKKLGPCQVAITFEQHYRYPVTIISRYTLPGQKPTILVWQARYLPIAKKDPVRYALPAKLR